VKRDDRPVLLVGVPRSGSTWAAYVLGTSIGTRLVLEPDNEKTSAPAVHAKRSLGRFPLLRPGHDDPRYRGLWEWAFEGAPRGASLRMADRLLTGVEPGRLEDMVLGRTSTRLRICSYLGALDLRRRTSAGTSGRSQERVVVKSVHSCLSVEWLAREFGCAVVVIRRHPANVLASWLELSLPDADRRLETRPEVVDEFVSRWKLPPPPTSPTGRAAWSVGLLSSALEESAARHPDWIVVEHEQLCSAPPAAFASLFDRLGLAWSPRTDARLESGERPGKGFSLERRSADLPDAWRSRLTLEQVAELESVLSTFPRQEWWTTARVADRPAADVPSPPAGGGTSTAT
jgi:hypothetical protein